MQTMMHFGNNSGPIIAQTFRMYSHWCQRTRYEHCAKIIRPTWRHCVTKRPNDWLEPLTIVVAHIPNNKQVNMPHSRCRHSDRFLQIKISFSIFVDSIELCALINANHSLHTRGQRVERFLLVIVTIGQRTRTDHSVGTEFNQCNL